MLVVGGREAREGTVAVRRLGQTAQETIALEDAIGKLKVEGALPASCFAEQH
jgi:threonyl-tRNA synthetase